MNGEAGEASKVAVVVGAANEVKRKTVSMLLPTMPIITKSPLSREGLIWREEIKLVGPERPNSIVYQNFIS